MARTLLFVKDMFSFFQSKLMMIPLSRSVLQDRKSPVPASQIALSDAKSPRVTASQAGSASTELPVPRPLPGSPQGSRARCVPSPGDRRRRSRGRGEGEASSRNPGCNRVLGPTAPGRRKVLGRAGCNFKLSGIRRLPYLLRPGQSSPGPRNVKNVLKT